MSIPPHRFLGVLTGNVVSLFQDIYRQHTHQIAVLGIQTTFSHETPKVYVTLETLLAHLEPYFDKGHVLYAHTPIVIHTQYTKPFISRPFAIHTLACPLRSAVRSGRIELPPRPWQGRVLPLNNDRISNVMKYTTNLYASIIFPCAPARTRTWNNWFEASRDIHFTTGARIQPDSVRSDMVGLCHATVATPNTIGGFRRCVQAPQSRYEAWIVGGVRKRFNTQADAEGLGYHYQR